MASRAPRRRWSAVSVRRSASVAFPVSGPAAIAPSAPTTTGSAAASKNARPRLLVTDGPENPIEM
jgi:hypothetical protein